jgi:hypothetical protein
MQSKAESAESKHPVQNQTSQAQKKKKVNLSITSQNQVSKFGGKRRQVAAKGMDEESERDVDEVDDQKESQLSSKQANATSSMHQN